MIDHRLVRARRIYEATISDYWIWHFRHKQRALEAGMTVAQASAVARQKTWPKQMRARSAWKAYQAADETPAVTLFDDLPTRRAS